LGAPRVLLAFPVAGGSDGDGLAGEPIDDCLRHVGQMGYAGVTVAITIGRKMVDGTVVEGVAFCLLMS